MKRIALPVNAMARYLMDEFWPGKITFVVFARPELPYGLTASSNKVGIRLVAHPVARDLIRVVDKPLTGTSANISGTGGCASVEELDDALKRRVDLIIDAGILKGGPGSTVVDVSGARPEILRPGAIAVDSVWQAYRRYTAKNIDNPD